MTCPNGFVARAASVSIQNEGQTLVYLCVSTG